MRHTKRRSNYSRTLVTRATECTTDVFRRAVLRVDARQVSELDCLVKPGGANYLTHYFDITIDFGDYSVEFEHSFPVIHVFQLLCVALKH